LSRGWAGIRGCGPPHLGNGAALSGGSEWSELEAVAPELEAAAPELAAGRRAIERAAERRRLGAAGYEKLS
jgi:hypothetical protein